MPPIISHPQQDKITCSKCIGCIGGHIPALSSTVCYLDDDVMKTAKMSSFYCTVDVDLNNRMAFVESVAFFENHLKTFQL